MDGIYQIECSIVKYRTHFDNVKNNHSEMRQMKEILEGVFEWVVDPITKIVTRRIFITGTKVSGKINQWGNKMKYNLQLFFHLLDILFDQGKIS